MDRLACVSLRAFPLQLLLRRRPEWAAHPVAVVAEDRPHGLIRWVNEQARRASVLPGLRYAAGCLLTADLRAGVVPPAEIVEAVEAITKRLRRFTPEVEPSAEEPGVFWLSGAGLHRLYPSREAWARLIAADLGSAGLRATVVVGFTRFGTYAVARAREGTVVLHDPADERAAARRVRLDRLDLDPDLRDTLSKLGVTTVGALLSLPAGGLFTRFGPEAYRLHRMAAGLLWAPLQPCSIEEPVRQRLLLDDPETDATRLLFLLTGLLQPLLQALAVRGEALAGLTLRLRLDGNGWRETRIGPAAPTLDAVQVLDLIRLRLEAVTHVACLRAEAHRQVGAAPRLAGVVELELTASGVPAMPEQLRLFVERPRRSLTAVKRALARIRATFGDDAVVRARLTDGHLPEARFTWEPLDRVMRPTPRQVALRSLVRRIFAKPAPLPAPPGARSVTLHGPHIICGGWWGREVHRDYYFAETVRGELRWVYYDPHGVPARKRGSQWFLHGKVE